MLNPEEWRSRHPRCSFCEYLCLIDNETDPSYYFCLVKEKIINYPKMPRPWCPCFKPHFIDFKKEDLV